MERIIGSYEGTQKGDLLVCLGGMHGNEIAGVRAIEEILRMLEREPGHNPNFVFTGKLVGLRGNTEAIRHGVRYMEEDLNRIFTPKIVADTLAAKAGGAPLLPERKQLIELLGAIKQEVEAYGPKRLIVLDLHTTSAQGGIFAIPNHDPMSVEMAMQLHAPVIRGMLDGLQGTVLHYFVTENMGIETVAVCFESGQHYDPLSVRRAVAAIVNCLRSIGCVRKEDVENSHDALLQNYSAALPRLADLFYVHHIEPSDHFSMLPGFHNFQAIRKGERLAQDRQGDILSPEDCHLLMPLYQSHGNDGFFLIKEATTS
jgi:succinylglutamate desuccinylase